MATKMNETLQFNKSLYKDSVIEALNDFASFFDSQIEENEKDIVVKLNILVNENNLIEEFTNYVLGIAKQKYYSI